ncbi:PHP domain-containing protein [Virgibacillus alimentarius]|uniref:Metal-dependent phosphoesterase TrpH n=1 Tax=Virgibacillus alimentarius TaxID=698769 RepID=A0ABS4S7U0_9BACI|nr:MULTISPECIES: PHP domain-containing protein [Virgibacillus]MBP2257552.1 putative metal-dependent phosphoesterase TrpH [Virgibacillus alimentarius]HLR68902.1 PHP domain-containing protein [Virgibacillus sp.]
MKADLHVHSNYSDGSDSIKKVMQRARENGVTQISFVDHDTVDGLNEAFELGQKYGMEVVPGVEISAYDFRRNRKVHILGYHYRTDAPHIKKLCQPLLERRHAHSLWQVEQIQAAGYALNKDKIIETAKPSQTVYKQHIMKHLSSPPYPSTAYQQLYKGLFKGNGVASGDIEYVDAFEAVRVISADGGIAVVAHPGQLDSYEIIPELIDVGLKGIERNHHDHTEEDHQKVELLAKRYNLMLTGGTDYHGSFGKSIDVGDILSHTIL